MDKKDILYLLIGYFKCKLGYFTFLWNFCHLIFLKNCMKGGLLQGFPYWGDFGASPHQLKISSITSPLPPPEKIRSVDSHPQQLFIPPLPKFSNNFHVTTQLCSCTIFFNFILFLHRGDVNFHFNWCSVFTEGCFYLWKGFEWQTSFLLRFFRFLRFQKIHPTSTPRPTKFLISPRWSRDVFLHHLTNSIWETLYFDTWLPISITIPGKFLRFLFYFQRSSWPIRMQDSWKQRVEA